MSKIHPIGLVARAEQVSVNGPMDVVNPYRRPILAPSFELMNEDAPEPDQLPNGAGDGETSTDAPDTASGGSPDQDKSHPPATESSDGTPVENPSGG